MMAAENFAACLAISLKFEGGDVHHPKDPGGRTSRGVTQATYDAYRDKMKMARRVVYNMTRPELNAIYKSGYWDRLECDDLPYGVDLCIFDYGVNSGTSRAQKLLDRVLAKKIDAAAQIHMICDQRLSFLKRLKTWPTFGKGWSRRVESCRKQALKMVNGA